MKTSNWKYFIFQLLCITGVVPGSGQNGNLDIIEKCLEQRSLYGSVSYDMELRYKPFSQEDTMIQLAKVELVRSVEDSLFGGFCSIDMDSLWCGYDGKNLLKGSPYAGVMEIVDAQKDPTLYIKGTWVDNFVDYGFLKLSRGLKDYLLDETIEVRYSDTLIGEWPCLGITLALPDEQGIYDQTFFIAIDTIDYILRNKMYSAYFQGNQQYTNWDYRQVQYGHKTRIEKLEDPYLSKFNSIVPYERDTARQHTDDAFDYSLLTGKVLMKEQQFSITDLHAKLIILDFWYTSCYPCIKSIPAVNEIYKSYKDKGVAVYGINPVDDAVKNKTRLENFLLNNPMAYETILVDKKTGEQVCAEGYPTFIILDQNFKVLYKESGYSENLYKEVSAILDVALKK